MDLQHVQLLTASHAHRSSSLHAGFSPGLIYVDSFPIMSICINETTLACGRHEISPIFDCHAACALILTVWCTAQKRTCSATHHAGELYAVNSTCLGSTGFRASHWKPVRARVAAKAMTKTSTLLCELPPSRKGATLDSKRLIKRNMKPRPPPSSGRLRKNSGNRLTRV
jgi:hypothetical protein